MNPKAYGKMNYGLYLISSKGDGKRQGCIVSSFAQVTSSNPARFTVTLNRDHETCKAVEAAGSFCVTVIGEDCPAELVERFGYRSGRVGDKFEGYEVEADLAGNPYLTSHMVSRISCQVTDRMEIGNYVLFVGEATEAELLAGGRVLTLDDYNNGGKPTPPSATVYRTVELQGYRCTVCGYVYEGESLPKDFVCPICRAPAEKFEKIEK